MSPQIVLSPAKLHKVLLVLALVICSLFASETGRAQGVVTATLTNNGSSTVNITSNQSFTLTLMINTNFVSGGITYFLQSNAGGSGLFAITAIDGTGSPYPPSPLPNPCGIACVLNPENDFDLGAGASDIVPAGLYTIATFTFSTTNAPLGQYTISTDRGVVTDRTGGGFQDRAFTALATINVVPEPTTVGLVVLGGAVLAVRALRRQRTRA